MNKNEILQIKIVAFGIISSNFTFLLVTALLKIFVIESEDFFDSGGMINVFESHKTLITILFWIAGFISILVSVFLNNKLNGKIFSIKNSSEIDFPVVLRSMIIPLTAAEFCSVLALVHFMLFGMWINQAAMTFLCFIIQLTYIPNPDKLIGKNFVSSE